MILVKIESFRIGNLGNTQVAGKNISNQLTIYNLKVLIQVFEEKLDNISEHLEKLILDAILSALRKIKKRDVLFDVLSKKKDTDGIRF